MSIIQHYTPSWVLAEGPDSDIVVTTRARLARNLAGFPFPSRASDADLTKVAEQVQGAISAAANCERFAEVAIADLGTAERAFLVDAHVSSYDHFDQRRHNLLLLGEDRRTAVMVNEEDHLRIQAILPGLQGTAAWTLADSVDDALGDRLEFAFSEQFGYLTASPTNLGTALRLSVMLHLGGQALMETADVVARAAQTLGISVRGLYGEGTSALGDFYQVSNEVSLGIPETEIVQRVQGAAEHYVRKEREAREYLAHSERPALLGLIGDILDGVRRADSVTAETALGCISALRLGIGAGLLHGVSLQDLNDLLLHLRSGDPALWRASRYADLQTDGARAAAMRRKLRNAGVVDN